MNRMAMTYLDKNRKDLNNKYPNIKTYKEKFLITEEILQELLTMAEEEKINFEEEQYNQSKDLISMQLKALIARDLFDMNEYFEIINDRNDSLLKALQIINDDELYDKILKGG